MPDTVCFVTDVYPSVVNPGDQARQDYLRTFIAHMSLAGSVATSGMEVANPPSIGVYITGSTYSAVGLQLVEDIVDGAVLATLRVEGHPSGDYYLIMRKLLGGAWTLDESLYWFESRFTAEAEPLRPMLSSLITGPFKECALTHHATNP